MKQEMSRKLDESHQEELRSLVESAQAEDTDFPLQNLPFGSFRRAPEEDGRLGVAIGDQIFDLAEAHQAGLLEGLDESTGAGTEAALHSSKLNALMALGPVAWNGVRMRLVSLLGADSEERGRVEGCLVSQDQVALELPATIGDYTDFYASIYHATNIGSFFRPDNPLLPNYKWIPIGYHGRASSVFVSGTPVVRPCGQRKRPEEEQPSYGPCRLLDYELEVGFFVGGGNLPGAPVPVSQAEEFIFGMNLVNDWSARDMQGWEYQPLGPFLAKSFATTVSPWVVTLEALAPFRAPAFERPPGDPPPLPHLDQGEAAARAGVDLRLEVDLLPAGATESVPLSRGNFLDMYWSIAQMLTHHASNGCNLRPGDLMASGTVSGPTDGSLGSMMEITKRGQQRVALPGGETRGFLEDGDEVILRGYCERDGFRRIGFGECRARVEAALLPRD